MRRPYSVNCLSTFTGRNACVTVVCLRIELERFKHTTSQTALVRKNFGPTVCNVYVSSGKGTLQRAPTVTKLETEVKVINDTRLIVSSLYLPHQRW